MRNVNSFTFPVNDNLVEVARPARSLFGDMLPLVDGSGHHNGASRLRMGQQPYMQRRQQQAAGKTHIPWATITRTDPQGITNQK
jgi:hypothetical protein